ncbi:MAG: DUF3426 domain-containing protein [Thermodesulfobacteriota bacterium]|nr:DUF3426 domain-containing protein [Thermodesulfobacteriota bacterium]
MIIICPECSTKFNVNPERIPDGGAKVRCARCKHVFSTEKPFEQEPAILEEDVTFSEESASNSTEQQDSPTQPSVHDESFSETSPEESDFSYDKFQELDSSVTNEESFAFGNSTDTANEDFFSDNQEEAPTTRNTDVEEFTFTKSVDQPTSTIEKVFTGVEKDRTAAEPTAAEKVTSDVTELEEPPIEPEFPTQPVTEKKGGAISSIIRLLLLLILGILIFAGIFVYMNGTDQLNQTIQQIFGQQIERPVQTGQITLGKLEGKFIQNEQDGELFLIHGEAINNFSESRAAIQVKGIIFDQNGKPLLQKTIFCGNPINNQKLLTLSFLELEKIMGNQFGIELSNMKIDSKTSIPFDIVFKNLPKNLSEFSVKVTSSKSATE